MSKLYIFNGTQYDEILTYLAEQEELQQRDLGHLNPTEVEDDAVSYTKLVLEYDYKQCEERMQQEETKHVQDRTLVGKLRKYMRYSNSMWCALNDATKED